MEDITSVVQRKKVFVRGVIPDSAVSILGKKGFDTVSSEADADVVITVCEVSATENTLPEYRTAKKDAEHVLVFAGEVPKKNQLSVLIWVAQQKNTQWGESRTCNFPLGTPMGNSKFGEMLESINPT